MKTFRYLALLLFLTLGPLAGLALAAPPAPGLLAPAAGASVQIPFSISWSAVSDPSGIVAYNWQVSNSPSFSPVLKIDSTSGQTEGTISGLAAGTYYWRVQAVNSAFEQGAWSAARSFTVTGAGSASPGTPVLDQPVGYSTFHPWENMRFTWSAAPGAASYVFEASTDPNFPVGSIKFDNIPKTSHGFAIGNPEGKYFARVYSVNADGIAGMPSNVIEFSVFYSNPVPPPPAPQEPANDAALTLPVTLTWAHTINPQPSGYEVQVSSSPGFSTNEAPLAVQLTEPVVKLTSLSAGTKYWRVRSHQGMASPEATAVTAWSEVRSFTISSAPPVPVSITPVRIPLYSGDDTLVEVQLSGAVPPGGASVALSSSNPAAAPVPASIQIQGTHAWAQFQMLAGQATAPTPITLTATFNGRSASTEFTLMPPVLKTLSITPPIVSGGVAGGGMVTLNGRAPEGGAEVRLASDAPAAMPPASVTIPAGSYSAPFSMPTADVGANTTATISAAWNNLTLESPVTVTPAPQPLSLSLFPATIVGGEGSSDATVTIEKAASFDQSLKVSSNNPTVLPFLSPVVTIPAGNTRGFFNIRPQGVAQATVVTLAVTGGGISRSAALTVNPVGTPAPGPTLSAFTVSPSSVPGGTPATGTVTLPSAAPSGGASVSLGSNLPGAASVPPTVTVPAGATSASFTITTFPSATTTVQLSAKSGDTVLFQALGVGPAAPGAALSAVALNPSSVLGGGSSTGTVTLSAAAPSGGASVALSDNASAVTVPASVMVPSGSTSASFTVTTINVSSVTTASVSAAYGGTTRSASLTVNPPTTTLAAPSLISPANDAQPAQPVTLDWADVSGATSYRIQIDDASTFSAPFVTDQLVTQSQFTAGTLPSTRHWWRVQALNANGSAGAWSATRRFTPQSAPAAAALSTIALSPSSVVGGNTVQGTATLSAAAPNGGAVVTLTSSHAAAVVPASVNVAAGSVSANFQVATSSVASSTTATIGGGYAGVNRGATLTIAPAAVAPSLSALSISPTSVQGGTQAQGMVSLSSPAPVGGFSVALASSTAAASVPASVLVAQGASSATFAIGTGTVSAATTASITGSAAGVTRSATLQISPQVQVQTIALTVSASGRSGERITSSPAGISVLVGSSASASFPAGTSITLSVSNGRDAVWSGACSSSGNRSRSCTFNASTNATVSASVQ